METRRWLLVALLAVACVPLILADDNDDSGKNPVGDSQGPAASVVGDSSGGDEIPGSEAKDEQSRNGDKEAPDENTGQDPRSKDKNKEASNKDDKDGKDDKVTPQEPPAPVNTTTNITAGQQDNTSEEPEGIETVTKKDFDIIGVRMKSYLGRNFSAFCGIPYAEPPIGLRRFKQPVRMTYDGNIDATNCEETPVCMQIRWHRGETDVIGVEDCLFLNVYEPEVASANMPVIVYFHGGGFFSGSGTFNDAGPHYFMDQDVVLVTVNYRLGPLGFFSLNDRDAPGNMGMSDQVLALDWVNKYIRHFHGDRFRVTIMGEGAGGASVHFHLLSSMSKGLFSRAISQSGVALNSWALVKDMVNISRTHAGIIGCKKSRDASTMKCMREAEAEKIVLSTAGLHIYKTDPLVVYGPMVQEGRSGVDIFLKKHPMDLLMQGSFHNVPWLVGVVNTPGFFRAERYLKDEEMMETLTKDFAVNGSLLLDLDLSVEDPRQIDKIAEQTKDAYENFTGAFNSSAVLQLFGDRDFNLGHMLSVAYHALLKHEHLYQYRFDYRGMHSMAENVTLIQPDEVVNEDDLIYLLKRPSLFPDFDRTAEEGKRDFQMMRKLTGIWAHFAATGEVKALHRNKREAVAVTKVSTDTRGTGHRRARRDDDVTQSSVDSKKSTIWVYGHENKQSTFWVYPQVDELNGNASQSAGKTWEGFLDLTSENKSTCWDNYAAIMWPAVKRFPDTPGNVATLPYLSIMKGGNDTPVEYCLRHLMEINRLTYWLQLPLDEVKPPDVFMNLVTTTIAATEETTVATTSAHICPTFALTTGPPPSQEPEIHPPYPTMWPWPTTPPDWWPTAEVPSTYHPGIPTRPPDWWPTTEAPYTYPSAIWLPEATSAYPPDHARPEDVFPVVEDEAEYGTETHGPGGQARYTWPQHPKPPEPPPPTFPPVDFDLPPLTTRKPGYHLGTRPKPPSRPSSPRQYFTWPTHPTTEKIVVHKPPSRPTRPMAKPPRGKSRAPRSYEVWPLSYLLLLLLLVLQF